MHSCLHATNFRFTASVCLRANSCVLSVSQTMTALTSEMKETTRTTPQQYLRAPCHVADGRIRRARRLEVLRKATSSAHCAQTRKKNPVTMQGTVQNSKMLIPKLHSFSEVPCSSGGGPSGNSDLERLLQLLSSGVVEDPMPPLRFHRSRLFFLRRASRFPTRCMIAVSLGLARIAAPALPLRCFSFSFFDLLLLSISGRTRRRLNWNWVCPP